ncbi:unnamed protein product, partial [marine sediment metagenome]
MSLTPSEIAVIHELRCYGATFQQIAAATGCDYKTAYKYGCNIKRSSVDKSPRHHSTASKPQERHSQILLQDLTHYTKDLHAMATSVNQMNLSQLDSIPSNPGPPKQNIWESNT